MDDRDLDYGELEAEGALAAELEGPLSTMTSSFLNNAVAYGNPVWLTNMSATAEGTAMTASFEIAGGTNNVPYDILTSANLAYPVPGWPWVSIGYTGNRYSFSNQPPGQAFYALAKPGRTMTVGLGSDAADQCKVPAGLTNALMVAAGEGQSLALLSDGTVRAWGDDTYGQGSVPTNLAGVSMISAGWYHDVALLTNGTVAAWGLNLPGVWNLTEVPPSLTNATVISAQALHTLALTSNGTVVAWGYGPSGEASVPAGLSNVVAIAAGFQFNLAAKSDGTVTAWGYNSYGQTNVPAGLGNVVDVAAGLYHSLALLNNGTVVAWGDGSHGETNVPPGLTNVVAITASGHPTSNAAYSLALKSDGTVVKWGAGEPAWDGVGGLSNVIAIAAGADHALAIRTGPRTPVITLQPTDQYQIAGGSVTFTARGAGLYGVTYQWKTNGVDIAGETNATLTLTNVQTAAAQLSYTVLVSNEIGSITSSNAYLHLVTSPTVVSQTALGSQLVLSQTPVTLSVTVTAPGQDQGFPLSYQWQLNGTNVVGATAANHTFTVVDSGTYSVIISNAVGTATAIWQITVVPPGGVISWGSDTHGQLSAAAQLTNVIWTAAGKAHGIVALESGSATNWGSYWTGTNFIAATAPPALTNVLAVAAGSRHDLALKADGTVVAWGLNDLGQTKVPADATNVTAISAGGQQSLALKADGTVLQWGQTYAPIPTGLTNATAIASGTNFHLALLRNSTVVAWGGNHYGQTNVPSGLSNVVAIAAGGAHALALKVDGTISAWGSSTNAPADLSNVMNVAAGENHSIAVKNDGTLVMWGDNSFGQTNGVIGLDKVKLVASGGDFTTAIQFSPLVQYQVDVTKDLLLICNTNSSAGDSTVIKDYYLAHRPLVTGANVLAIDCPTNEIVAASVVTNQILNRYLNWLAQNPTKHPPYIVLFPDIPSRVRDGTNVMPSVAFYLHALTPGIPPFVTSLNMRTTNDCRKYIDKLEYFGTNYSPGKLIISASAGGCGNTNYVLDNVRNGFGHWDNFTGFGSVISGATNALLEGGVASPSIFYADGLETITNGIAYELPHLTNVANVAAYISWGAHSSLGWAYATDGLLKWSGQSGWWIIQTIESYNGVRDNSDSFQGYFLQWFSEAAFGGTDYSNTPVGAVTHVDEPYIPYINDTGEYFSLWAGGKIFARCAWISRRTPRFQAVGDPFVSR